MLSEEGLPLVGSRSVTGPRVKISFGFEPTTDKKLVDVLESNTTNLSRRESEFGHLSVVYFQMIPSAHRRQGEQVEVPCLEEGWDVMGD
jgi:hypothetical protein